MNFSIFKKIRNKYKQQMIDLYFKFVEYFYYDDCPKNYLQNSLNYRIIKFILKKYEMKQ